LNNRDITMLLVQKMLKSFINFGEMRIEARPLATIITLETVKKFFWQNIVC
jgi:hypothetical protein